MFLRGRIGWLPKWMFGVLLIPVLASCAGRPGAGAGAGAGATPAEPAPYIRVRTDPEGTLHLETAIRVLRRPGWPRRDVVLAGVLHVGDDAYFRALQARLDAGPVVLYEGVGADGPDFQDRAGAGYSLQSDLAGALGLVFQLEAVDYRRSHFQNSDLGPEELGAVLERVDPGAAPQMEQLMGLMDGSSWLGGVARIGIAMIRASPRLQATVRLVLVETLGALRGDLSGLDRVPDGIRSLLRVLIDERNAVVLRDLARLDGERPRPASVWVLYGAGHMTDLERRLRAETGSRPVSEEWLTAFSVNPARSGLGPAEVGFARRLAEMQLRALGVSAPSAEPGTDSGRR